MLISDDAIKTRASNLRFQGIINKDGLTCCGDGENSICGDAITVGLLVDDEQGSPCIKDVVFDGYACSLCMASTDLLLEHSMGMGLDEAVEMDSEDVCSWWGNLEVGITREKCIKVGIEALRAAIETYKLEMPEKLHSPVTPMGDELIQIAS